MKACTDIEKKFKENLEKFIFSTPENISVFYQKFLELDTCGLFEIEKREVSNRVLDIGPPKPFRFKFKYENDKEELKKVIGVIQSFLRDQLKIPGMNQVNLLLMASLFDDHLHDDPLKHLVYDIIGKSQAELLAESVLGLARHVNWKQDFDLDEKMLSISDWESLFRSYSRLFMHNNVIDIVIFSFKFLRKKKRTPLPDLLRARLLFELSLDTYLKVFEEEDLDFILGYVFSRFAPHFKKEEGAVEIVRNHIQAYCEDSKKMEQMIIEIFTAYYYKSDDSNPVCEEILKIIAHTVCERIKNKKYSPILRLSDFIIYPRLLKVFELEKMDIDDVTIANHITDVFSNSFIHKRINLKESVSFGLPYNPSSNAQQEVYSYLLWSFLKCSEDNFNKVKISLRNYSQNLIPYFFGRYESSQYAFKTSANIYLILLSVIWVSEDSRESQKRFSQMLDEVNTHLLEPFSNVIANHARNFSRKRFHDDEMNAFFVMMHEAKSKDRFEVYKNLSENISKLIPLEWPWDTIYSEQ